jgi:predicted SnoaL-like aldol condensation-catalyzing enzyme
MFMFSASRGVDERRGVRGQNGAGHDRRLSRERRRDGWEGQNAYLAELALQSPRVASDGVNVNNIVLVDGDLFALHHHAFAAPDDPGRVSVDIWRVDRGKIVEHWAVRQAIPSTMAHANGMACGKGDDYAGARARPHIIGTGTRGAGPRG